MAERSYIHKTERTHPCTEASQKRRPSMSASLWELLFFHSMRTETGTHDETSQLDLYSGML